VGTAISAGIVMAVLDRRAAIGELTEWGLYRTAIREIVDSIAASLPEFLVHFSWLALPGLAVGMGLRWWIGRSGPSANPSRSSVAWPVVSMLVPMAALVLAAGSALDERFHRANGPNVLIVLVDTLRPDHLGAYGYERDTSPVLDRFAREAVVFEHATANAPWTKPSVATLLTSRPADDLGISGWFSNLEDSALTLFELFRDSGYRTFLMNGGSPHITPRSGFAQGVDDYAFSPFADLDVDGWTRGTNSSPAIVQRLLDRLEGLGRKRFAAWLHFMDPHLPYAEHEHNGRYTDGRFDALVPGAIEVAEVRAGADQLTPAERAHLEALYDGQIRKLDDSLATLLEGLEGLGLLDETIVVVTSDHGEEFWEHGGFEHGHTLYEELVRVPLIVRIPGVAPHRPTRRVQHLDMLPTLLELVGRSPEGLDLDGRSFAPLARGEALPVGPGPDAIQLGNTLIGPARRGSIVDRWKLIETEVEDAPDAPRSSELYDLAGDPAEQLDRAAQEPERVATLTEGLPHGPEAPPPKQIATTELDDERLRMLKALGYVDP